MIAIDDYVFTWMAEPPTCPADYRPEPKDIKVGDMLSDEIIIVAKECAKARGETHDLAYFHYIGTAVTWLSRQPDQAAESAVRASDPDVTCDPLRGDLP
jgi:hypothetical protein